MTVQILFHSNYGVNYNCDQVAANGVQRRGSEARSLGALCLLVGLCRAFRPGPELVVVIQWSPSPGAERLVPTGRPRFVLVSSPLPRPCMRVAVKRVSDRRVRQWMATCESS